jgi:SSS family transporter
MHWLPAGITMTAVSISAITFIGMPGQAFKSDWKFLQIYMVIPFAAWLVCKWFLPQYSRLNVGTAYEYLESRFDRRTRLWASALFQLILCGSTGVVIYAPAIMLSEMTAFSVPACILIVGVVTTIYTMRGGIKGVIYTDLLQAFLLVAGWAVVAAFLLFLIPGGVAQAWQVAVANDKLRLFDFTLDPRIPATFWAGIIAMSFTHLALAGVNQTQVQKFMTIAGMEGGRRAILFHGFTQIVVYIMFFALGTLLFVYYRSEAASLPAATAPDRVLAYFIMRELPPGWRGLLVVSIFAPAMSTTSSALNSLASATVLDFLGRRAGNTVLRAKVSTLVWGVVVIGAGLLAWRVGSILELIVKVNSYFYGCLLGVFLLGMLTERTIAGGARFGLIAGMAAVLTCSALQPALWIWFGAVGCLVCMAAGYCWSLGKSDEIRYRSAQRARH